MEKWKRKQKRYEIREIVGIVAMVVFIFIGGVCDWNVLVKGNILISIGDIESFSLTILQIQATVGMLIFTIIALITGNISDSYMGVPISDFYLNIKPWILTQKVLVFISLGLCIAGVIAHSLSWYNIVFYLFLATFVAILLSILEIYSAFKGRNIQIQEIESYVNYMLESNIAYGEKVNIYQNFVLDWKDEVDSQDKQSYEKYLEVFKKSMLALWEYRNEESLLAIKQQCYSMSYCLLWSEKTTVKERGIEFIQDIYDILWGIIHKCITEEEPLINQYKCEFPFFAEIHNELVQNMDELNVENVEKRLRFGNIADLIQRTAIWFKYDKEENEEDLVAKNRRYQYEYSSEISELNSFARYIGYYLGKQQNKNNTINQRVWAEVLSGWSIFSDYNIPEERKEYFLKVKVNTYFAYCYGMLVNGQENVVKQGLYLKGMKQAVKLNNKYQALLYLVVHCYIYYLAERESDDCIPEDIRQSAKNIWEDGRVKDAFLEFLNMLSENAEWLDLGILNQMYRIVDRFELFPKYESVKSMIIETVVSDYYIFLISFMSHEFYMPELLERNIDDMRAFRYVEDGSENKTKDLFKNLYIMTYIGNKSEEKINTEVDLMYDSLEKMVKKKQKERYIRLAKEEQESYEVQINEKVICDRIRNDTIKSIKEKFAPILIETDEQNGIIDVPMLNLIDYTSSIGAKNNVSGHYSDMAGMFLYGIVRFLYQRKVLDEKNRFDDFPDDKEFMEYLATNDLHILLGSPFILKNRDYKISAEYKKFLEDYETIYTAALQDGIALKKDSVQVCLHEINVSIHSPSIEEMNAEYIEATGRYNYAIVGGLPIDFEEEELKEFVYNNRKVINVTAKVSIQVNEMPCGTIFTGRKRG